MTKRIENFLKNLSIEQLKEVRTLAEDLIYRYDDGFLYQCKIRSYGRNWTETLTNEHSLQDLCYRYDGDDGIIDVYTTNPNLNLYNYGDTYYFPTLEDAEIWRNKRYLENYIPQWEKELEEWNNRDNVPFAYRPKFSPLHKEEDIHWAKEQLKSLQGVVEPVRLGYVADEIENEEN